MTTCGGFERQRTQTAAFRSAVVICTVVICESLLATVIFPFIYLMVKDFPQIEEHFVGFWTGVITSAYFLSQAVTVYIWGVCSDKLGRKPVLLFGLVGGTLGMVAFGFSRSVYFAIIARCICGSLNGNAGVARTALGELAHEFHWNQGKTFSLFGLCSAIGYITGPLIGGYLSNPSKRWDLSSSWSWFRTFPYLLPCCIMGLCSGITFVLVVGFLEETRLPPDTLREPPKMSPGQPETTFPESPETEPLLGDPVISRLSLTPTKIDHRSKSIQMCVLSLGTLSFHSIIFDEIYPVFASTRSPNGLGLTVSEIALTLSVMGPIVLVAALLFFPFLHNRYSTIKITQATGIVFGITYCLFSLLPQAHHIGSKDSVRAVQLTILFVLMAIRFGTNVIAYTSLGVLLNDVAVPSNRGAVMGLAQTSMSLGRAIGPAFGGAVWSWSLAKGFPPPFDSHLLYVIESVLAVLQYYFVTRMQHNEN